MLHCVGNRVRKFCGKFLTFSDISVLLTMMIFSKKYRGVHAPWLKHDRKIFTWNFAQQIEDKMPLPPQAILTRRSLAEWSLHFATWQVQRESWGKLVWKFTSSLLPALGSNGNSEFPGRNSVSVIDHEKMLGRINLETKVLPLPSAQKRQAGERGRRSRGRKKELGSLRDFWPCPVDRFHADEAEDAWICGDWMQNDAIMLTVAEISSRLKLHKLACAGLRCMLGEPKSGTS